MIYVRPRYKRTDVGIIPEDWEPRTIGDCTIFSGGTQPRRSTFVFSPRTGYIRLVQIRDYKSDEFATYIPLSLARKFCAADDIMIGRYGPPIFQILRGIEGAYNVALIKAENRDEIIREFLFYVLCKERLFDLIDSLSRRSTGQTGVEMSALKSFPLPLPRRPEQNAIAEALGDADALIGGLEALVAKKRDIKQGAMQELLTGQRRLPGFHREWVTQTIGSIFDFGRTVPLSRAQLQDDGNTRYVHYGDIHTRFHTHLDFKVTATPGVDRSLCMAATTLRTGDWVFADASEDYEGVAKAIEITRLPVAQDAVAGLHTFVLRERALAFAPGFKGFLAHAPAFRAQIVKAATGTRSTASRRHR